MIDIWGGGLRGWGAGCRGPGGTVGTAVQWFVFNPAVVEMESRHPILELTS